MIISELAGRDYTLFINRKKTIYLIETFSNYDEYCVLKFATLCIGSHFDFQLRVATTDCESEQSKRWCMSYIVYTAALVTTEWSIAHLSRPETQTYISVVNVVIKTNFKCKGSK